MKHKKKNIIRISNILIIKKSWRYILRTNKIYNVDGSKIKLIGF